MDTPMQSTRKRKTKQDINPLCVNIKTPDQDRWLTGTDGEIESREFVLSVDLDDDEIYRIKAVLS